MLLVLSCLAAMLVIAACQPTAHLSTGTHEGIDLPTFSQEAFLGVRYAPKPTRFTPSTLFTGSSSHVYNSGYSCPAWGTDTTNLVNAGIITLDEDCLSLNVIKPSGYNSTALPVLVWIFGGGWQQGATADPRYNLSYIVQQSVESGTPVIGVSMNYRLGGLGFLYSDEVKEAGVENLGLKDQRVALEFIQREIGAFGGDPEKITIWGESAGAYSVGAHLLAYGGRDHGLFRAAILDSGTAIGPPYNDTDWYQPLYDGVVAKTSCSNSTDTLSCLRDLPYSEIYPAVNTGYEWFAVIDGDFVQDYPVTATEANKFVKVPLLLGSNTDEGTSFGVNGVDTDEQAVEQLTTSKRWNIETDDATQLLTYYPNDPAVGSPYGTGNLTFPDLGLQYKRYSSMAGDITMAAPRRFWAQQFSKYNPVYSYRFDVPSYNTSTKIGVGHFADIPFVMANPVQTMTPLGPDPSYLELGKTMARLWTAFVSEGDPNRADVGVAWPKYGETGENIVLRNDESYVEEDTYRKEGMEFINSIVR